MSLVIVARQKMTTVLQRARRKNGAYGVANVVLGTASVLFGTMCILIWIIY